MFKFCDVDKLSSKLVELERSFFLLFYFIILQISVLRNLYVFISHCVLVLYKISTKDRNREARSICARKSCVRRIHVRSYVAHLLTRILRLPSETRWISREKLCRVDPRTREKKEIVHHWQRRRRRGVCHTNVWNWVMTHTLHLLDPNTSQTTWHQNGACQERLKKEESIRKYYFLPLRIIFVHKNNNFCYL